MKVPKKIYDAYQKLGAMDNQLMAIAVLQHGWGQYYNKRTFSQMQDSGLDGEYDKEIGHFIYNAGVDLAIAILNGDIELDETLYNVKLSTIAYISADGVTHHKDLFAKKSMVGGAVDFESYEGSLYDDHPYEFTLDEIKHYGLDDAQFERQEVQQCEN